MVPEFHITKFGDPPAEALEKRNLTLVGCKEFGLRWNAVDNTWVIPIRSAGGVLLGWQEKGEGRFMNRPPGMPKGSTLFGLDRFTGGLMVLVESPLDAVYLYELGYSAVASCGAGVTDQQMRLIVDFAEELVLALDNDGAGKMATRKLVTGWDHDSRGRLVKRIKWSSRIPIKIFNYKRAPDKKDPGEMEPEDVVWAIETARHPLQMGLV